MFSSIIYQFNSDCLLVLIIYLIFCLVNTLRQFSHFLDFYITIVPLNINFVPLNINLVLNVSISSLYTLIWSHCISLVLDVLITSIRPLSIRQFSPSVSPLLLPDRKNVKHQICPSIIHCLTKITI